MQHIQTVSSAEKFKQIFKALFFCIAFTGLLVILSQIKTFFPPGYERFVYGIIGTITAVVVTWIFLRFEKKRFRDIGLKWEQNTLKRYFLGFVIGLALSILLVFVLLTFTGLKLVLTKNYDVLSFLTWTLALVPLALMEEIAFRAYPFVRLRQATGIRITQLVIAILFALYHFAGGQSMFSSFLGPGVWSFVFGLAVIISGGISLASGLHVGANLFLAAIGNQKGFSSIWTLEFRDGITVSSLQRIEILGNILQIILLIATLIVMEWWLRRKKKST